MNILLLIPYDIAKYDTEIAIIIDTNTRQLLLRIIFLIAIIKSCINMASDVYINYYHNNAIILCY